MTPTTKRLTIALVISIAINLFLGGFIAARAIGGRGGGHCEDHHARHGHFFGPRALMRDGDPEVERAMHGVMERRGPAFRAQREKLRATREKVAAAFEAEPFDPQALDRALAELRAQTAESQRLMHEAIVEAAPSLTPDQRVRLTRRTLERGPGPGR